LVAVYFVDEEDLQQRSALTLQPHFVLAVGVGRCDVVVVLGLVVGVQAEAVGPCADLGVLREPEDEPPTPLLQLVVQGHKKLYTLEIECGVEAVVSVELW